MGICPKCGADRPDTEKVCLLCGSVLQAYLADDFEYYQADDMIEIVALSDEAKPNIIVIPASIEGLPVAHIGMGAFAACENLTSIEIPDSVVLIDQYAFAECKKLRSITIPSNVKFIGDAAFLSCESLTSVTIPKNVECIGKSVFEGCINLRSITIPESVTIIDSDAFKECEALTIRTPRGSYAERYARECGLSVVDIDSSHSF